MLTSNCEALGRASSALTNELFPRLTSPMTTTVGAPIGVVSWDLARLARSGNPLANSTPQAASIAFVGRHRVPVVPYLGRLAARVSYGAFSQPAVNRLTGMRVADRVNAEGTHRRSPTPLSRFVELTRFPRISWELPARTLRPVSRRRAEEFDNLGGGGNKPPVNAITQLKLNRNGQFCRFNALAVLRC